MRHFPCPAESEQKGAEVAVSGDQDKRVYVLIETEVLKGVAHQLNVYRVFLFSFGRNVHKIELVLFELQRELCKVGSAPVGVRLGGNDPAQRFCVFLQGIDEQRVVPGRGNVLHVPNDGNICHASILLSRPSHPQVDRQGKSSSISCKLVEGE